MIVDGGFHLGERAKASHDLKIFIRYALQFFLFVQLFTFTKLIGVDNFKFILLKAILWLKSEIAAEATACRDILAIQLLW